MLYLSIEELNREINKILKQGKSVEELKSLKQLIKEIAPKIQVKFYHQEYGCYAKVDNKDICSNKQSRRLVKEFLNKRYFYGK